MEEKIFTGMEFQSEAIQTRLEMQQYKIRMHFPYLISSHPISQVVTVPRQGQQLQEDHLDQSMI